VSALIADPRGIRVACPTCGQTNRLRYETLDRQTRCGKCQSILDAPGAPVAVDDEGVFDAMREGSTIPIAVDFWAPWCGPCRMMAPELDRVARAAAGRWLVVKVDTEQVPSLGQRFRIRSIPTLAVFRQGREATRTSGAMPASEIQRFLENA